MTKKQAQANLKQYGKAIWAGCQIVETVRRVNGWDKYTGNYKVYAPGEYQPVEETYHEGVSAAQAFKLAEKYGQR